MTHHSCRSCRWFNLKACLLLQARGWATSNRGIEIYSYPLWITSSVLVNTSKKATASHEAVHPHQWTCPRSPTSDQNAASQPSNFKHFLLPQSIRPWALGNLITSGSTQSTAELTVTNQSLLQTHIINSDSHILEGIEVNTRLRGPKSLALQGFIFASFLHAENSFNWWSHRDGIRGWLRVRWDKSLPSLRDFAQKWSEVPISRAQIPWFVFGLTGRCFLPLFQVLWNGNHREHNVYWDSRHSWFCSPLAAIKIWTNLEGCPDP